MYQELVLTGYEILSLLVAVVASAISAAALVRTRKNTSKLIALEEVHAKLSERQLDQLDKQEQMQLKANLTVRLDVSRGCGKFIIENSGPATASKIYFSLGQDTQYNPLVSADYEQKLPYPALHCNESYFFLARFPTEVRQIVYDIDLRWFNEDGVQTKRSFSVSR